MLKEKDTNFLYFPSFSTGEFANYALHNKIVGGKITPRFWSEEFPKEYRHDYFLLTAGHLYKKMDIRKRMGLENALVLGDSGGYQIATGAIIPAAERISAWKVNLIPTVSGTDYVIQLTPDVVVTKRQKVFVQSGKTYASNQFWLDDTSRYQLVPIVTAVQEYLYYQDSSNPLKVGKIKIIDGPARTMLDVSDIIGAKTYTSPNGIQFTNGLRVRFVGDIVPRKIGRAHV